MTFLFEVLVFFGEFVNESTPGADNSFTRKSCME